MPGWWDQQPEERYWLEIADRADLDTGLEAPLTDERGREYWSYSFVREVEEGDVVFHYRARPTGAITHWSRAISEPYEDEVVWGAHGQASGRGPVDPYPRPGVRHPLEGPFRLASPVSSEQLRGLEDEIRAIHEDLRAAHPGKPLYFPFQISDTRELRAFQGYLTKFPAALVERIPELSEAARIAAETSSHPYAPARRPPSDDVGGEYRIANRESRTARRQPFSVDPDLVDRALQSHAATQELLADAVRAAGLTPRSPAAGEPLFDIAWRDHEGGLVVAEIKSLTDHNEEKQLRLALGQVLRYSHLLGRGGVTVRRAIAAERKPSDATWIDLCEAVGVALVWPEAFERLF